MTDVFEQYAQAAIALHGPELRSTTFTIAALPRALCGMGRGLQAAAWEAMLNQAYSVIVKDLKMWRMDEPVRFVVETRRGGRLFDRQWILDARIMRPNRVGWSKYAPLDPDALVCQVLSMDNDLRLVVRRVTP